MGVDLTCGAEKFNNLCNVTWNVSFFCVVCIYMLVKLTLNVIYVHSLMGLSLGPCNNQLELSQNHHYDLISDYSRAIIRRTNYPELTVLL